MDKKAVIEKVIAEAGLKEKVDEAFKEIEEQAKAKLIEEIETAIRKKLEKEVEKKAALVKAKARKRMRKALLAGVIFACSAAVLSSLQPIVSSLLKRK